MGVGLVMLGASMPLLVLPSTLTGVGAALCFMGVSCALAVTGTLPQVPLNSQPLNVQRISLYKQNFTLLLWRRRLQLAAEVERMAAVAGGVNISLDAVYSMFNTAWARALRLLAVCTMPRLIILCIRYALGSIMGPTLGLWMVQGIGMRTTYILFGTGIAAFR
jgi:hypothetical protein